MKEIVVNKKYDGKKLNSFLLDNFDGLKLNTLYKALRKKDIRINNLKISDNVIVHFGDVIKVFIPDEQLFSKVELDINIVYEDNNIVVVNKPAEIEVVGDNSLTTELCKYYNSNFIAPCHRLDRNTTGLVLFAKNEEALNILLDKFKYHEIEKHYQALVYGIPRKKEDTLTAYLFKDAKKSLVYISDVPKKSYEKIITSYRNTKNFDENWIASTYAIHWIRSIRCNHRARSVLRLATNIQGTGFLFASEIVKDGWKYTSLTEDRALTADAVAQGYQITYNDEAMFYDEQPTSLKIALRQRLRWSKGHLLAFCESGPYLFLNIFFGKLFIKTKLRENTKKNKKSLIDIILSIIESIRHRFASYDTLLQLTPFSVFNLAKWIIVILIMGSCYYYNNGINNIDLLSGGTYLAKGLRNLFSIKISVEPGINALFIGMITAIWLRLFYRMGMYIQNMWVAVYVFIIERKNIKKMTFKKKILYTITWPIFDIIGRYTTYAALFMKVTWKPIPHDSKVTIDDIDTNVKEKVH